MWVFFSCGQFIKQASSCGADREVCELQISLVSTLTSWLPKSLVPGRLLRPYSLLLLQSHLSLPDCIWTRQSGPALCVHQLAKIWEQILSCAFLTLEVVNLIIFPLCRPPMAAVLWAMSLDVVWSSSNQQPKQKIIYQIPLSSISLLGGVVILLCPVLCSLPDRFQVSQGSLPHCLAIYLSVKFINIYGPRWITVLHWSWMFKQNCSITRCFSMTCTGGTLYSSLVAALWCEIPKIDLL